MSSFKDFVKQRREKQAASGGGRAAKRAEAKGSPAAPKPQPAPQPPQPVAAPRPQPPAAAPQPPPKPRGPDAKAELVNRMVPSLLASMQVLATHPRALVAGPVEEVGQGYVLYCSAALTCLGAKQPGNKALGPGLEMPFFDFGNVRFSRDHDEMPEAGTVVATLGAPRPPPKTSATAVFVHPFADALRAMCEDGSGPRDYADLWGGNWVVPPYMELRAAGHAVDLAPRCVAGAVNVLCGFNAPYLGDPKAIADFLGPRGAALVALADSGKLDVDGLMGAGLHVLAQNERQYFSSPGAAIAAVAHPKQAHWLPMFPQQGLKPRDRSRGDAVTRAVFVGCRHQLDRALQAPAFVRKLKDELGVDLDVVHKGRAQEWRDYAAADVVVAVREADPGLHVAKPPSKIINAWLAGVPAILGRESAPRSLRTNDLDFVEVDATPDAVFAALAKMKRDPAYYAQLRARCDVKAAEFSRAALAKKWADLIDEIRPR